MSFAKPDYGIDAPGLMKSFLGVGLLAAIAAVAAATGLTDPFWQIAAVIATTAVALYALGMGSFMFFESRIGKVKGRETILDCAQWRGNEKVLDVGCGRGLMLIGAAKRLTDGRAIGVDIWQASDQSSNGPEGAKQNAVLEGVAERVEVQTADMLSLPFDDGSFDIVTSHWVIHNLDRADDREKALDEMLRVLKPGGTLLLTDIANRNAYREHLQSRNVRELSIVVRPLRDVILAMVSFGSFRPATIVARIA